MSECPIQKDTAHIDHDLGGDEHVNQETENPAEKNDTVVDQVEPIKSSLNESPSNLCTDYDNSKNSTDHLCSSTSTVYASKHSPNMINSTEDTIVVKSETNGVEKLQQERIIPSDTEDVNSFQVVNLTEGQYVNDPFTINILLIGRSQVGKSTLIESLQNHTYSSRKTGISQTRGPTYKQLKLMGDDKKEYTLNIIDTPGFQEIRHDPNETRTDQKLFDLLRKVFDDGRIRTLNMIGFVSVLGYTYQNDIDTFKSLIDFFGPKFKKISALILTHCEKTTDEKIKKLTEELQNHPTCKEAVGYCELGIHYHGTLDVDDLETYDEEIRDRMCQKVLRRLQPMREELIRFLLSKCNNPQEVKKEDFARFHEIVQFNRKGSEKLSKHEHALASFKEFLYQNGCEIL